MSVTMSFSPIFVIHFLVALTTVAPSLSNSSQMASPSPRDAPVTNAVRPSSLRPSSFDMGPPYNDVFDAWIAEFHETVRVDDERTAHEINERSLEAVFRKQDERVCSDYGVCHLIRSLSHGIERPNFVPLPTERKS